MAISPSRLVDISKAAMRVCSARLDRWVTARQFAELVEDLVEVAFDAGRAADDATASAVKDLQRHEDAEKTRESMARAAPAPAGSGDGDAGAERASEDNSPAPGERVVPGPDERPAPRAPAGAEMFARYRAPKPQRSAPARKPAADPERKDPVRLSYTDKFNIRRRYDREKEENGGRAPYGLIGLLAAEWNVSSATISRIVYRQDGT